MAWTADGATAESAFGNSLIISLLAGKFAVRPAAPHPNLVTPEGLAAIERCFQAMLALAAVTALLVVGLGLSTFFCLGDLKGFVLVALGGYGSWRLYRTALNNVPRDYTPDRLPEFLLS